MPEAMAQEDVIHEHVKQYLAAHPEFRSHVQRQGDGDYVIEGREVKVGFCRQGFLVVHDGPLRQPFTDYVEKKESTAIYHQEGLKNSTLNTVPKATRISFGDESNRYTRLDAMKVAKEQAIFREKAANCAKEGGYVPADLREKYEKTIATKLGKRRFAPQPTQPPAASPPAWWPGVPANTANAMLPAQPPNTANAMLPGQPPNTANAMLPGQPPSHVPPMALASVATAENLFGNLPDLFQMAAARNAPMATARPMLQAAPMPTAMTPSMPTAPLFASTQLKAPRMTVVAGPLCGA